ncbi:hypothetical protein Bca4012_024846 [Brassica carinata]
MSVGINSRMVAFVVHALAVVVLVMVFVWSICYRGGFAWESTNKTLIFNLHPVLTLISLVILGGEAIISYKSLPFGKRANKLIHLVLHAIAIILGILGIYAAFKHHNEKHIPNLYTIHSWVGIGVIVLYSLRRIINSQKGLTSVARLDKFGSEAFLVNFMAIITILFGAFVLLIVYSKAPPTDEEDNYSYSAI